MNLSSCYLVYFAAAPFTCAQQAPSSSSDPGGDFSNHAYQLFIHAADPKRTIQNLSAAHLWHRVDIRSWGASGNRPGTG